MMDSISAGKNKLKRNELCFYFAYILLIMYRVLKSSTIGIKDGGITYIVISILFLFNVFQIKIKKSKIISIFLVAFIVFVCIIKTMDPVLPVVLLALIASKNIKFNNIVKVSFIVTTIMVLLIVSLSFIGCIEDTQTYRFFGNKRITCHGVGFHHSSALPTYYCFLFISFFYLMPN